MKELHNCCTIAQQLCENPLITIKLLAENAELARNTASKYLKRMYAQNLVVGPWMTLRPHQNYKEYVYLMNFTDPLLVFDGLRGFPHVMYHGVTFGDWNTIVITNRPGDFSRLKGFETMVYEGVKGLVYTPRPEYTTWGQCWERMYETLVQFNALKRERVHEVPVPFLDWGEDEWKLYHTFRFNMRKAVTPILRKVKVTYETYTTWMDTLKDHCTIHTEFYPEGRNIYNMHCFLLDSDHKHSVKSLFSWFPTTPVIMEVGTKLLAFLKVVHSDITRDMICTVCDMKTMHMVKRINHAQFISELHQSPHIKTHVL